jgi:L-malate glycosyltransferase
MNEQVLIISFWNPTERYPQQGIFIQDQAAAVCSLRENVIFLRVNVLPSKSPFIKKEISEAPYFKNISITINIYSLFWKFYFVNPWILARIVFKIIKTSFPRVKPALIHSNVIFPCGIVGYLLSCKTGSKMIISEHWSKVEKLLKNPLYRGTALKAYKSNAAVLCVSEFLAEKIKRLTGHENILVIPNIVNTDLFPFKPKPVFDGKELICTCVATWKPPKRLDLIVESLTDFAKDSGINIRLNIVGNGIQTYIYKSFKVPEYLHITWHGFLDKKALASLLSGSHLFLHASDIETFSIVTAEALSTGTPAIVSKTGALPELIHKGNGLLAENNRTSWHENLREFTGLSFEYEKIALENRLKFSPENIGNAINDVYNKVLNVL